MTPFHSTETIPEKVILVGLKQGSSARTEESLAELGRLVVSAGGTVVSQVIQRVASIHPAHVVGKGKLDTIAELITSTGANLIVFDDELSPSQIRNLEERLERKIIDRSMLILAIFARHAHSKEAKTQVELAQYEYLYPRLSGQWTHLSKQWGGIGSKGPGETQLEVDRRLVGKRIQRLKEELKKIDRERAVQRRGRDGLFKAVMVGYTNAGKSTLFNALTRSQVWAEDRLFCTLDPTSRVMSYEGGRHILLTDTIGFIRKLPAPLFAAFRATLSEVTSADLLIHVIDYSNGVYRHEAAEVESTLAQIDATDRIRLDVLNKIDLLNGQPVEPFHAPGTTEAVAVSALTGVGLDRLIAAIDAIATKALAGMPESTRRGRTARASVHWEESNPQDSPT